jgi:hypothetical protein
MTENSTALTRSGKIIGIILIILGLLTAIGPWTIFPVCDTSMMVMACHYTAEAEIVIGSLLLMIGVLLIFVKRPESKISIGLIGAALGVWTILIPTVLIGVCASDMMNCVKETRPALIAVGVVTILVSIILILLARNKNGLLAED